MPTVKKGPGRPTNASKGLPVVRPRPSTAKSAQPPTKPAVVTASKVIGARAKYDAGGVGRRMTGWNPPASGPNEAKAGTIAKLRTRTRDSVRNDWAAESAAQKWSTTLIGVGITPRFKRIKDLKRRVEITDLFNDWFKVCDADGSSHGYAMQTLAVREHAEGGECFIRLRWRDDTWGLPVPLQLQMYEAEQCPMVDYDYGALEGLGVNSRIKQGKEFNRHGRLLAYWFYKEHPGEAGALMGSMDPTSMIRVAASEIFHVFKPKRAGEVRGTSMFAPILVRLRDANDYEDTTLLRQKLANLFVAVLKKTLESKEIDVDPLSGEAIQRGAADEPLIPLQPGAIQELAPGEDLVFQNPPEAGTTFSDYLRTTYLGTAAGIGIPYELLSGDIKDISDRTLRIIVNDFRRYAEQEQWQIFIPRMCDPIVGAFADAAVLAGKITIEEAEMVKRCEHAPHGWPHIHPVQDPQGKQLEMQMGVRSRSSVIAERGDDRDQVDEERSADKKSEEKYGLEEVVEPVDTNLPNPTKKPKPKPKPKVELID